jgi:transcriptional regulator
VRIKPDFAIDVEQARAIVAANPFATIVTSNLRVTRMPFLLEVSGLTVVGHVARADPVAEQLGGPLLLIFSGPHGYISASWYDSETIPTWNHQTVHLQGRPELFDDALPILRRTVDHFEAAVEHPWSLDRMGETAREMADQVIAFRIRPENWHAEAKLSQDKPGDERERILAGLERPGPYAHAALAAAMRSDD